MQAPDAPFCISLPLPTGPAEHSSPRFPESEEAILFSWPLGSPALRYDVASLEHWLDLNA